MQRWQYYSATYILAKASGTGSTHFIDFVQFIIIDVGLPRGTRKPHLLSYL